MPYEEYLGWQEFWEIEPFGLMVQDSTQAHIAVTLANLHRDTKKRSEPYRLSEFMLFDRIEPVAVAPIFLEDKESHSKLIMSAIFGKKEG